MSDYVLGTDAYELERLRLQHEVWRGVTDELLDRLAPQPGARCLDVGCGPGFVVEMLRERIGTRGHVTALDESPAWHEHLLDRVAEQAWTNVELVRGRIQDVALPSAAFDVVFMRWVLSFLPEPLEVVARLADALVPGGRLGVIDYNHEGVSVFPESEGLRAMIRGTRALYAAKGGDTWIGARLPGLFRRAGLELESSRNHVLSGGPSSPAFRWADAFFTHHCHGMVSAGVVTAAERDRFLEEWTARRADPDAVFFSPIVIGASARKPG